MADQEPALSDDLRDAIQQGLVDPIKSRFAAVMDEQRAANARLDGLGKDLRLILWLSLASLLGVVVLLLAVLLR